MLGGPTSQDGAAEAASYNDHLIVVPAMYFRLCWSIHGGPRHPT
jgi:hypothetical protein